MTAESTVPPYRVLARKYRPGTFEQVIGQEALVRTLTNAIAGGRIAHAFMLTGVRGVGKTTTARLIARALNCIGPDGEGGPTIKPCGVCEHCRAIAEDRHVDVIEMDAASRTGVDDIRELIEGVRYHPVSARNKVYIIDEVHMLSKPAFNALLKTLEEPPEHVHFVFATTEVRKVPVTVLSRCQRFDLRRVSGEELARYFQEIAEKETVEIDEEAMALISNAADGSVRDGLSLFDQAITLGDGKITNALVRDMLGLADRTQIFDLFDHVIAGRIADALEQFVRMYRDGVDPVTVMQDLLELTHWLTRLSIVPDVAKAPGTPEAERTRGLAMANALSISVLSRAWQMLLKGLGEVQSAPSPRQAGEMVLIRLAYVAELPTPAELIAGSRAESALDAGTDKADLFATADESAAVTAPTTEATPQTDALQPVGGGTQAALAMPMPETAPEVIDSIAAEPEQPPPTVALESFEDVVALFAEHREVLLRAQLFNNVHLVRFEPGRLELRPDAHAQPNLANRVSSLLTDWTGTRWVVTISSEPGAPTLAERERGADQERWDAATRHPMVRAVTDAFPGAKITRVTALGEAAKRSQTDEAAPNGGVSDKEDDG